MNKMTKRIIALFTVLCLLVAILPVKANTVQSATTLTTSSTIGGAITETEEANWYCINLASAGKLSFKITSYLEELGLRIYNSSYESITGDTLYWDSASQVGVNTFSYELDAGIYYIRFVGNYWDSSSSYYTGTYRVEVSFASAGVNHSENNNSFETASEIAVKSNIKGHIAENNTCDYYKIQLTSSGKLKLKITSYLQEIGFRIYDDDFNSITGSTVYWDSASKVGVATTSYNLQKGTYYIRVIGNDWDSSSTYYLGNYKFTTSFTSAKVNHKEPNNSFEDSVPIKMKKTIRGQIAKNNSVDYYKLKVTKKGKIKIKVISNLERIGYRIYNSSYQSVTGNTIYLNSGSSKTTNKSSVVLSKGTYYIRFIGNYWDSTDSYYYGNYSVMISK